jgi:hypothetical protein
VVIAPSITCSVTRNTSYGATNMTFVVSFVSPRVRATIRRGLGLSIHRLGDRHRDPRSAPGRRAPPLAPGTEALARRR